MADINLLQNQLKDTTLVSVKRTKLVVWLCLVLLLVAIAAGAALFFLTQKVVAQTAVISATNTDLQNQLNNQEQGLQDAQNYQAQLSNIGFLLQDHIAFSPLIDELSKYTYQKALYTVVDVAQDTGKIHVEGIVDSYTGLGKLLLGLSTSGQFQNVKLLAVNQATGAVPGVTFSIDMAVTPDAFKKSQ